MTALDQLRDQAQPQYAEQVASITEVLEASLGTAMFAGVDIDTLLERMLLVSSSGALPGSLRLQTLSAMLQLSWWTPLTIDDAQFAALGREIRAALWDMLKATSTPPIRPEESAMRRHVVFTGELTGLYHSPTPGAIEYLRALASERSNEQIAVFHKNEAPADVLAHLRERLGADWPKFRFHRSDEPEAAVDALASLPCTFHFWCEDPVNPAISLLTLLGPTVMFTCGDVAPIQHADVYWYCQNRDYIEGLWRRRGVPEVFVANYHRTRSAPFLHEAPGPGLTKPQLGVAPDHTVLATVGNRLSIDLDEAFVTGMETLLCGDRTLHWLVVGELPENLLGAMQMVLGAQFLHLPFASDLVELMHAVDIFANPFRKGGGNTAVMAIAGGAVVLTRADLGDVAAFVPDTHGAVDEEDYFERLEGMVADPDLRRRMAEEQRRLQTERLDQELFAEELRELTRLAFERFRARAQAPKTAIFDLPEPASELRLPPRVAAA